MDNKTVSTSQEDSKIFDELDRLMDELEGGSGRSSQESKGAKEDDLEIDLPSDIAENVLVEVQDNLIEQPELAKNPERASVLVEEDEPSTVQDEESLVERPVEQKPTVEAKEIEAPASSSPAEGEVALAAPVMVAKAEKVEEKKLNAVESGKTTAQTAEKAELEKKKVDLSGPKRPSQDEIDKLAEEIERTRKVSNMASKHAFLSDEEVMERQKRAGTRVLLPTVEKTPKGGKTEKPKSGQAAKEKKRALIPQVAKGKESYAPSKKSGAGSPIGGLLFAGIGLSFLALNIATMGVVYLNNHEDIHSRVNSLVSGDFGAAFKFGQSGSQVVYQVTAPSSSIPPANDAPLNAPTSSESDGVSEGAGTGAGSMPPDESSLGSEDFVGLIAGESSEDSGKTPGDEPTEENLNGEEGKGFFASISGYVGSLFGSESKEVGEQDNAGEQSVSGEIEDATSSEIKVGQENEETLTLSTEIAVSTLENANVQTENETTVEQSMKSAETMQKNLDGMKAELAELTKSIERNNPQIMIEAPSEKAQEVAMIDPAPEKMEIVEDPPMYCMKWSGVNSKRALEVEKFLAEYKDLEVEREVRIENLSYIVYLPQDLSDEKGELDEIYSKGVNDTFRMKGGDFNGALSLGLFKNQNSALKQQKILLAKGISGVKVSPKTTLQITDFSLVSKNAEDLKGLVQQQRKINVGQPSAISQCSA